MSYWARHQDECRDGCVHTYWNSIVGLQYGEILFYHPRSRLPPIECPELSIQHLVVSLPHKYKNAKYLDNNDYLACLVVTSDPSHPDQQEIVGSRDEPQIKPLDAATALYQEDKYDNGVDWEPVAWSKVSNVGLHVETFHMATLHRLRPKLPNFRAKLDTDSYRRLLKLVDNVRSRTFLRKRSDWWTPINPFFKALKAWDTEKVAEPIPKHLRWVRKFEPRTSKVYREYRKERKARYRVGQ